MYQFQKQHAHSPAADKNNSTGARPLSPATLLFNCPVRGIMPVINRPPISTDNDHKHHKVLVTDNAKMNKTKMLPKNLVSLPIGSAVAVQ